MLIEKRRGVPVTLSDTEAAVAWLDNFDSEDRELASRLLDAFVLDSWTSARASLLELLRSEIEEKRAAGTVWVLPAMDSGDIQRAMGISKLESLTAFANFEPGMDIPSMPGSEGLIGHLLRDVQGPGVLPPTAQIPALRENRLRTIIVVSDTIETGSQVAKYVQALLRNTSLKSWRSFGWIRLTVLAFAVSAEGKRTISSLPEVDSLRFIRHAPTVRDLPWTRGEIDAALDLCIRYGVGKDGLGYGSHAGLFGFQDRVPNTIPKIFRQRSAEWTPLFIGQGGRSVPSGMVHELASGSATPTAHDQVILAVRQERLAASLRKQQRESHRDILAALALLRVSPSRADLLGVALNLTQPEVETMLAYMQSQGWIGLDNKVTESGVAELTAGKRKPRRVEPRKASVDSIPYYPQSLR